MVMKIMKVVIILAGLGLLGFGLLFVIGGSYNNTTGTIINGVLMLLAGGVLLFLGFRKQVHRVVERRELDLTGDVGMEHLKCRSCGGTLDASALREIGGTAMVECPFCGSAYQMEEAPKW
jgi:DNA-directed RNA polymerase subunit RPC12/RpoP